jgi:hypothetical protein
VRDELSAVRRPVQRLLVALIGVIRGSRVCEEECHLEVYGSSSVAAEYMEWHARVKKKTWRDDQRRLEPDLLPQWGERPANEITRRDVIAVLDRVADRGAPISANRLRALVSGIFNFGIARELVEHNLAFRTPRPGVERATRSGRRSRAGGWRACSMGWMRPSWANSSSRKSTCSRGRPGVRSMAPTVAPAVTDLGTRSALMPRPSSWDRRQFLCLAPRRGRPRRRRQRAGEI